jgi:predicted MPP superfamily phosphohydrolase
MRAPVLASYDIKLPNWPAGVAPLRIVQISDSHANTRFMPASRLQRVVDRVNALKPDIVVLTGDYAGDGVLGTDPLPPDQAVAPFAGLKARLGVYAVLGNHDHLFERREIKAALERAHVRLLNNERTRVGPVMIAGIDDWNVGRPDLSRALYAIDPARPTILLSHTPDAFPRVDRQVGLTLAGHTHGGQIAPPLIGPILTASIYGRRYVHGHVAENGHDLIVSAGLGTSVLPIRIGVPPEIVLVTVH